MTIKRLPLFFLLTFCSFFLSAQNDQQQAEYNPDSTFFFADLRSYDYNWVSYRAKITVDYDGSENVLNFFVVNRIDSILYVNVSVSGMELARLVVTPDSAIFVNKMQKTYFRGGLELLPILFRVPLDFEMLQAIVNAKDFRSFSDVSEIKSIEDGDRVQLVCDRREHLSADFFIAQKWVLNSANQLVRHKIELPSIREVVDIEYDLYQAIGTRNFFNKILVETSDVSLEGEIKNVKFNVKGPTYIKVPDKFTPIQ